MLYAENLTDFRPYHVLFPPLCESRNGIQSSSIKIRRRIGRPATRTILSSAPPEVEHPFRPAPAQELSLTTGERGKTLRVPQPRGEMCVAALHFRVLDGRRKGVSRADKHDQLFTASGGGIDKVSLKEYVVLHDDGDDHRPIFRPLRFVYGDGVGKLEFVQFGELIGDDAAVEVDRYSFVLVVYREDEPEVAVEDVLLVVVSYLHHFVAPPELA